MSTSRYDYQMMVSGNLPLSDHCYLTITCLKNHGLNGQTIRLKSNDMCVFYRREYHTKRVIKINDKTHNEAMKKFEDIEFQRELKRIESEDEL